MKTRVHLNGELLGLADEITWTEHRDWVSNFYGEPLRSVAYDHPDLRITMEPSDGPETHSGRPGWDDYYLGIAKAVAARGDCSRRRVGAVIVGKDNRIVSTGYNGVPPGHVGCLTMRCDRVDKAERGLDICEGYSDCRSTHAEANAIIWAGRPATVDATLYCTDEPCGPCDKLIRSAGIIRVKTPNHEWEDWGRD